MASTKELSELLATLYAAPLEPAMWQVFFDRMSALTKVSCGYLMTSNRDEGPRVLAGGGFSFNPEALRLYQEHFGQLDPFWAPFMNNARTVVLQGEELVSHDQLVKTEYYNDLLAIYEMEYMTMMSCNFTAEQTDIISVWRNAKDGPMDDNSIDLLQMLLPHTRTALKIRSKLALSQDIGHFAEMTLDTMSIAALLVNAKGRVRHMNHLAATHLQSEDGLFLQGGRLAANDSGESARLELLIAGAALNGRNGSEAVPGGAIRISRALSKGALQVTVLPVPERNQIAGSEPSALVLVSDPSSLPRSRTALMRQLYGLTPAESRVADLLLEGLEVREAAERLCITLETARFHVKRVLVKTGAHRQTELLRIMLSLPGYWASGGMVSREPLK